MSETWDGQPLVPRPSWFVELAAYHRSLQMAGCTPDPAPNRRGLWLGPDGLPKATFGRQVP